jgi:phage gpG-like protein
MNVNVVIDDRASSEVLAMQNGNARFAGACLRGVRRASQEIVGIAVKESFTGKGPFPPAQHRLGVVTGRLRKSIRASLATLNPSTGEIEVSFGSNVKYFGVHEFGHTGTENVKGHVRKLAGEKTIRRGKLTKKSSNNLKSILQRGGKTYANVRPHKRKVDVPARAPLGTVLRGIRTNNLFNDRIGSELAAVVRNSRLS